MAKVLGIGGVFFKANDPTKLGSWYQDVLGIEMGDYGAMFTPQAMPESSYTAFSLFKASTDYFDVAGKKTQQSYLINLLVDDLIAVLANIERHGGKQVGVVEEYDYGKFGWFTDPEGNKIELWQAS